MILLALIGCEVPVVEVGPPPPPIVVDVHLEDGFLVEQVRHHVGEARRGGRVPFAQLTADWCGPCRALRSSMDTPEMQEAFAGTYIVQIDTVEFKYAVNEAPWPTDGFSIPSFFVLREDGSPGASIDGHAWGENVPREMAPALRRFFVAHGAR